MYLCASVAQSDVYRFTYRRRQSVAAVNVGRKNQHLLYTPTLDPEYRYLQPFGLQFYIIWSRLPAVADPGMKQLAATAASPHWQKSFQFNAGLKLNF
jgi:hypothetical protein